MLYNNVFVFDDQDKRQERSYVIHDECSSKIVVELSQLSLELLRDCQPENVFT